MVSSDTKAGFSVRTNFFFEEGTWALLSPQHLFRISGSVLKLVYTVYCIVYILRCTLRTVHPFKSPYITTFRDEPTQ